MEELLKRYDAEELKIIDMFFEVFAKSTRKTGKISKNIKIKQLKEVEKFDTDVVTDSMKFYINMPNKPFESGTSRYTVGIIRNKQKNKGGGRRDAGGRNFEKDNSIGKERERSTDRNAERNGANITAADLDCDF